MAESTPGPVSPPRRPPPRAPRTALLNRPRYLQLLVAVLLAFNIAGAYFGLRHRETASRYLRRERDHHATLWKVEQAGAALARAERMGGLPGPDDEVVEDIRGLAEQVKADVSEMLEDVHDEEGLHRLRGHALELLHEFDGALQDYADAIRIFEAQTERYRDRENVPRSLAYVPRGLLRARLFLRSLLLDEDDPKRREAALDDLRHARVSGDDWALAGLLSCVQALCLQEYSKVAGQGDMAVRLDPTDWRPAFYKAVGHFILKDDAKAGVGFAEVSRAHPYFAEAHAWRGRCLLRGDRPEEAVAALGEALAVDPGFFEAAVLRGQALLSLRRADEAEAHFQRALASRPGHRPALVAHAQAGYEAWGRGGRRDGALLRRALESATRAVEQDPRDPAALLARGSIRLALGEAGAAISDAESVLALAASPAAHRLRAEARSTRGDWAQAAADFGAAGLRRERVRALVRARDLSTARTELEPLVAADPRDSSLALELARILFDLGEMDAAAQAVAGVLAGTPGLTAARVLRAEILLRRGDAEGAIREASAAHAGDPLVADPLLVRGRAHAHAGRPREAAADWRKAGELEPARASDVEALLKGLQER